MDIKHIGSVTDWSYLRRCICVATEYAALRLRRRIGIGVATVCGNTSIPCGLCSNVSKHHAITPKQEQLEVLHAGRTGCGLRISHCIGLFQLAACTDTCR